MSENAIRWIDNTWAAKYGAGEKEQVDQFDHIVINGSEVYVSDFLTSAKYDHYGKTIEERSEFLKKELKWSGTDLNQQNALRFSSTYQEFIGKNKTQTVKGVPIYFSSPEDAANSVKRTIDYFVAAHPEWTVEDVLSLPSNRSRNRSLYYEGKFPDGDQAYSGAMTVTLPKYEIQDVQNVGIYFDNPKEAADSVQNNIDQFVEKHPEWTVQDILSHPYNYSIGSLYYSGQFPEGNTSYSGAMSLYLPKS